MTDASDKEADGKGRSARRPATTESAPPMSLTQDYAIRPVPEAERKPFLNVSVTTGAWVIAMSTLWTGSVLAQGMPFAMVVNATILGMGILVAYGAFMGWLGARYGVSTTVLAREAFGRAGSSLLGIVFALTLGIGWFGWQIAFFAQTLATMFPDAWLASYQPAVVWGGSLMILTAFIGYRALSALSMFAVPLIVALSAWGLWVSLGAATQAAPPEATMSLFEGVSIVVGNAALGAVIFPDLTRYARTASIGALATCGGYFLGGVLAVLAGAAITASAGTAAGNLPAAMAAVGMGFFAFLILLFAQWTTNDNNLYSGALGLANVVRLPKSVLCIAMGLVGMVIALSGVENYFVPYLNFLSSYVPPIAGVVIADHWIVKRILDGRDYQFGPGAEHAGINWLAVASVLAGGFLGGSLGFGITPINAIAIAFALYAGGAFLLRRAGLDPAIGRTVEDQTGF